MGKEENTIQGDTLDYLDARPDARGWRNNVGAIRKGKRFIRYGLCKGSSDIIGLVEVKITKEKVGKRVAVFTGIELKTKDGKATDEQRTFLGDIVRSGGIGILATSVMCVSDGIRNYIRKLKGK